MIILLIQLALTFVVVKRGWKILIAFLPVAIAYPTTFIMASFVNAGKLGYETYTNMALWITTICILALIIMIALPPKKPEDKKEEEKK